jgi:hypothetical protein
MPNLCRRDSNSPSHNVKDRKEKGKEMTNEGIIVLCEQAIDGYEEGGERAEVKYLLDALYEIRATLINKGEMK